VLQISIVQMLRQTFQKRCGSLRYRVTRENDELAERRNVRANGARGSRDARAPANRDEPHGRIASAGVIGEADERDALRHMGTYVPATRLTSMPRFAVRSESVENRRVKGCCRRVFTVVTYVMAKPLT